MTSSAPARRSARPPAVARRQASNSSHYGATMLEWAAEARKAKREAQQRQLVAVRSAMAEEANRSSKRLKVIEGTRSYSADLLWRLRDRKAISWAISQWRSASFGYIVVDASVKRQSELEQALESAAREHASFAAMYASSSMSGSADFFFSAPFAAAFLLNMALRVRYAQHADAVLDAVGQGVLETRAGDPTVAADGLGDLDPHSVVGEEDVRVALGAGASGHPRRCRAFDGWVELQ